MLKLALSAGRRRALEHFGIPVPEESHKARNTAIGAAAASPFLGMIGEKKLIHDPYLNPEIPRFENHKALSRAARAGDVLVTTTPERNIWKSLQEPMSGTPFYHAQPVVGREGKHGLTMQAGEAFEDIKKGVPAAELLDEGGLLNVNKAMKMYPDVVLMRPKKPMTKAQGRKFGLRNIVRSGSEYNNATGTKAWLHDIFVPKIPGLEKLKPCGKGGENICSTMPAQAYDEVTGMKVIRGKPSKRIMPADLLRSDALEVVGASLKNPTLQGSAKLRRAMPFLARGGMGLGLGAGAYAVSEDPAIAAAPIGATAGSLLLQRALKDKNSVPSLAIFAKELAGGATTKASRGAFLGKRLPAYLGGAGLAYAGAKGLQHVLSD